MLENVIFDTGVDKQEIKDTLKSEVKRLGERLSVLQQDIKKNDKKAYDEIVGKINFDESEK